MKWQIWWLHRCIRPRRLLTWKPRTFRVAILTYLDGVGMITDTTANNVAYTETPILLGLSQLHLELS